MKSHKTLSLKLQNPILIRLAAIISCLPPMMIGTAFLHPLITFVSQNCLAVRYSLNCRKILSPDAFIYLLPVGFTCLFFTPVVGLISYRYVKTTLNKDQLRFFDLLAYAVGAAILCQLIAAVLHFTYLFMSHGESAYMLLLFGIPIHIIIVMVITIPLTLVSVSLFTLIALKTVIVTY